MKDWMMLHPSEPLSAAMRLRIVLAAASTHSAVEDFETWLRIEAMGCGKVKTMRVTLGQRRAGVIQPLHRVCWSKMLVPVMIDQVPKLMS